MKTFLTRVGVVAMSGAMLATTALVGSSQAAAARKPVTIQFWYGLGGTLEGYVQKMVDRFNASHPGIKVEALYQGSYSGGGPEQQKLLTAIASGSVPAVAQMEANSIAPFAAAGALLPLDSLMKHSSWDQAGDFLHGMLPSGSWKGVQYAIPFNRSVPVLFYNAQMFHKAGIGSPPATWPELAKDAKLLTHGSGKNKVYGFDVLPDWWPWESWTLSSGGKILNAAKNKALFDSAQAVAPMVIQQQLVKEGYAKVYAGSNYWTEDKTDFATGKTAMYPGSPGDIAQLDTQFTPSVRANWRIAFMPTMPGEKLVVPPGGGNAVIFRKAPKAQQQAAWVFMQWFTAPAQQVWWSEHTGYLPVTGAAVDSAAYQKYLKTHPQGRVVIAELKHQGVMPLNTHYVQMLQFVEQGIQGVFDELKPVQATMHGVAQRIDQVMSGG